MNSFAKIKLFLRKNKYFEKIYLYVYKLKSNFVEFIDKKRIYSFIKVYKNKKLIFKVLDMGKITRYRAKTFESKEPETLNWIDNFDSNDTFLDIGANVGIDSIYAAVNNIKKVISIEPDALNYALLNVHIQENRFNNIITPYCLAIHDTNKFSKLNFSSFMWGGAENSFDNKFDFNGDEYSPVHSQGIYGVSLDSFLSEIDFKPNHIKIDVDGNEHLILVGAFQTLKSRELKSLLIELNEGRNDYKNSLNLIKSAGFELIKKSYVSSGGKFKDLSNHIFYKN